MAYQTEIEKINPDDSKRGEIEEVCIIIVFKARW